MKCMKGLLTLQPLQIMMVSAWGFNRQRWIWFNMARYASGIHSKAICDISGFCLGQYSFKHRSNDWQHRIPPATALLKLEFPKPFPFSHNYNKDILTHFRQFFRLLSLCLNNVSTPWMMHNHPVGSYNVPSF